MSGLREQIAVLDGLGDIPSVLPPRVNVIDPSGGVNYGGGSSYPGYGFPLLPSNAGLAALDDLSAAAAQAYSTSASSGGNYSGGSTYPDVPFPLLSSTIGLAGLPNKNVYASYSGGANYSGGSNYPDNTPTPVWAQASGLADLQAAAAMVYGSASGGANYSGGSTYPDVPFPLTSNNAGLAGCATCGLSATKAPPTRDQLLRALVETKREAEKLAAIVRNKSASVDVRQRAMSLLRKNKVRFCMLTARLNGRDPRACAPQTRTVAARKSFAKKRYIPQNQADQRRTAMRAVAKAF